MYFKSTEKISNRGSLRNSLGYGSFITAALAWVMWKPRLGNTNLRRKLVTQRELLVDYCKSTYGKKY